MAKRQRENTREQPASPTTPAAREIPRDARGRWLPGVCPNPGGRPKELAEVRQLAKQYSEEAIHRLVWLMRHGRPDRVQVAAADALLSRAFGRPEVAVTSPDGSLPSLTLRALRELADAGRHGHGEGVKE